MKILGIDPGSVSMGYAIIEERGGQLQALHYGTTAIKARELVDKLPLLQSAINKLVRTYKPDLVGIEKLFFAKNKKTALEVAQARGAILLSLLEHKLPILEFTPAQVKVAVTSYGSSDKVMVAKMVSKILRIDDLDADDNASDALAIAITTAGAAKVR